MSINGKRSSRKNKGSQVLSKIDKAFKGKLDEFVESWGKRLENLEQRFVNITNAIGKQFGIIEGNTKVHADCIQHMDVQQDVMSKVLQDIYHRIQVLDHLTNRNDGSTDNPEEYKKEAEQTYKDVVENCFKLVQEERQAREQAKREELEKAQKALEEAEQAKKEAEVAEDALRSAEAPELVAEGPGGPGSDIPEGAEVFGD